MNRRGFLARIGAAVLAAAMDVYAPATLAEAVVAPPEPTKVSWNAVSEILREYYLPRMRDQLLSGTVLLRKLRRGGDVEIKMVDPPLLVSVNP